MHRFLRAVGFAGYTKKKDERKLIETLIKQFPVTDSVSIDADECLYEIRAQVAPDMGVMVMGSKDDDGNFFAEYYYPYLDSRMVTSQEACSIYRHTAMETYAGLLDEYRVGISLIFYLQNEIQYRQRKQEGKVKVKKACLSGLSISGKILFPVKKTKKQIEMAKVTAKDRNNLIEAAKNGDEDAMESLTIEDIDMYSKISRRMIKEDIYSIIDSCFMPSGIECDQYTVLGEIMEVEMKNNSMTGEEVCVLTLDCNDMNFKVCINRKDLTGEPRKGRRFKGQIWMQGFIEFDA